MAQPKQGNGLLGRAVKGVRRRRATKRYYRATAREAVAKAKREDARAVRDSLKNPGTSQQSRFWQPRFCSDCERELTTRTGTVIERDGRHVCRRCHFKAHDKSADKAQLALFGKTGTLWNPTRVRDRNDGRRGTVVGEWNDAYIKVEFDGEDRVIYVHPDALEIVGGGGARPKATTPAPSAAASRGRRPTKSAQARLFNGKKSAPRTHNLQGFMAGNTFHPIRASEDYDEGLHGETSKAERVVKAAKKRGYMRGGATAKPKAKRAEKPTTKPATKPAEKRTPARRASRRKDDTTLTLAQFVRSRGGIRPNRDGEHAGELRRLSPKESGTTGLVNRKSRYTADGMAEIAREAGYPVTRRPGDFLAAVEGDARGYEPVYSRFKTSDDDDSADGYYGAIDYKALDRYLSNPANRDKVRAFLRNPSRIPNPLPQTIELAARTPAALLSFLNLFDRLSDSNRYPLKPVKKAINRAKRSANKAKPAKRANGGEVSTRERIDRNSQMFQGRVTGELLNLPISRHDDGVELSRAGQLRYLRLLDRPASCDRAAKRVANGWHFCNKCSLKFDPSKSYLGFDAKRRLYLCGKGVQRAAPTQIANPSEQVDYGRVDMVGYVTDKAHIAGGRTMTYIHPFAEDTRRVADMPRLLLDSDGMPRLVGGRYRIGKLGIVN